MISRSYIFYCLTEAGSHVRYFGITTQKPGRRLLQHYADASRSGMDHRKNWIRRCVDEGIHIDLVVLRSGLTRDEAFRLEIRLIRLFKKAFRLVNTHRGGSSGYNGLSSEAKIKHNASCRDAKAKVPVESRRNHSYMMLAAKEKLRIERGNAELAICGDNEVNSVNERIQYVTD